MKTYYITTPIYYVNDRPHIGHAYATLSSDAIARYHRLLGEDVLFLTGTDENAQKNVEAAHASGVVDVQEYVDQMAAVWQQTWDELGVSNNDFIRTTEERHLRGVEQFWNTVKAHGDIYQGTYEGLYCVGCETFYLEKDLVDGLCPDHKRRPEALKEENYFFRLQKYRDQLLDHIAKHPEFVQPESRRNEIVNYIRDHLTDMSISRPWKGWGIRVPGDESQVVYVWFDALLNYLTAVGYGTDEAAFLSRWPANLHVVGKDIIKFHCAIWPAMLLSAGLPLPERVFAHGHFTLDGQKVSKSLGNAIDPRDLVETYGLDALRYFLLREIPFGGDGDFSIARVAARYDADLASGLGNTVSRCLTLAKGLTLVAPDETLKETFEDVWQSYHTAMQENQLSEALDAIWRGLKSIDQYIDRTAPWKLKKDEATMFEAQQVIANLLEALRQTSLLLIPFLPTTAEKIARSLGTTHDWSLPLDEIRRWGATPMQLIEDAPVALFPRLTT